MHINHSRMIKEGEFMTFQLPGDQNQKKKFGNPEYENQLVQTFQQKLPGHKKALRELQKLYEQPINKMITDSLPKDKDVTKSQLLAVAANKFPDIVNRYDPQKGGNLFQWVNTNLRGHLGNVVREDVTGVFVPRGEKDFVHRFRQARHQAIMEYGTPFPTDDQIFQFYPRTREEFEKGKRHFKVELISDKILAQDDEGHGVSLVDMHTGIDTTFKSNEQFFQDKNEQLFHLMQSKLLPDEYKILNDYLIKKRPMSQVALDNNVSTTKIRNLENRWNQIVQQEGVF